MAVISFRKPEEGLDYYKHVLDLVSIFRDVVHNPDAVKNIQELSDQLSAAQALSDDKKKELADAQEIIAQSQEFLEEFEKLKAEHEKSFSLTSKDLQSRHEQLQADISAFSQEKVSLKNSAEKAKTDAETKLVSAQKLSDSASSMKIQLDKREDTIIQREQEHNAKVAEFEKSHAEKSSELEGKIVAHQAAAAKLAEDRKTLDARKQKLDAMLKEAL